MAANTEKTYERGKRKFCKLYQVPDPIIPNTESITCHLVERISRTVQRNSIKVYLSTTKHPHLQQNYHLELHKFIRLQYVLRGIKRSQTKTTKIAPPPSRSIWKCLTTSWSPIPSETAMTELFNQLSYCTKYN